jgi:glycosyltransferase involved in cell wall biosynthesis
MNVLVCSSWPRDDGLTRSTVEPAVESLRRLDHVDRVELFAPSRASGRGLASRLADHRAQRAEVDHLMSEFSPDVVIARGVPAGNLALHLKRRHHVRVVIESFEPHARYMRDAGVWSSWGPKFMIQTLMERRQRSIADHLVCLSRGFRDELLGTGVDPARVSVMPCLVDAAAFAFDGGARSETRDRLGIRNDDVVIVHLGKFGGVYYDDEAFAALAEFASHLAEQSFVMVLTPHDAETVRQRAAQWGISRLSVQSVEHDEVPRHLAAADVAITSVRRLASSAACSPVKDAEYWANGLPVLISPGIGDDADLVAEHRLGVVVDLADPTALAPAMGELVDIAMEAGSRERIAAFARSHRDVAQLDSHYERILAGL